MIVWTCAAVLSAVSSQDGSWSLRFDLAGVGINSDVFEGTSYVVEFMLKALV